MQNKTPLNGGTMLKIIIGFVFGLSFRDSLPYVNIYPAATNSDDVYTSDLSETNSTHDPTATVPHRNVRVLCWIMTYAGSYDSAVMVRDTWAKRCDKFLFVSDREDASLPAIGVGTKKGRAQLAYKTRRAFNYIYENHIDDADWFLKADDDTYVIVENLRHLLSAHAPTSPVYIGRPFKHIVDQGYNSGGAGYVLSKKSLEMFFSRSEQECQSMIRNAEDVYIGKCMEKLGVKLTDARDEFNRTRFHINPPYYHLQNELPLKTPGEIGYRTWDAYGGQTGTDVVSNHAVSFHHLTPEMMLTMEYCIYNLRPYGVPT